MEELIEEKARLWFENVDNKLHEILSYIETENPPLDRVSIRVASLRDEIKKEERNTLGYVLSYEDEIAFEFALFEIETRLNQVLKSACQNKCLKLLMDAEQATHFYLDQFKLN